MEKLKLIWKNETKITICTFIFLVPCFIILLLSNFLKKSAENTILIEHLVHYTDSSIHSTVNLRDRLQRQDRRIEFLARQVMAYELMAKESWKFYPDCYIAGFVRDGKRVFENVEEAKSVCLGIPECTGVTTKGGKTTLRAGEKQKSARNEDSWIRTRKF